MVSERHSSTTATEETLADDLSLRWHKLLFSVRRSIRYHSRRESFFSRLHRTSSFINVILGTATVAAILNTTKNIWPPSVSLTGAALITGFSALDLVLGFADRAKQHAEFRRRFISIESCMTGAANERKIEECIKDRLVIEGTEPPKMFALDILCHNELMRADGYDLSDAEDVKHFRHVTLWQRLTANVWPWEGAKFAPEQIKAKRREKALAATAS